MFNSRQDKEVQFNQAKDIKSFSRYQEVFQVYNQAIKNMLNSTQEKEFHFNKGNVLMSLGQYQNALEAYNQAITIDHNYKEAYKNKSNVLMSLGRYQKAFESYDQAIKNMLNSTQEKEFHFNKGNVLISLGQYQKALEAYNQAIKIDPNYKDAYNNKGNVLACFHRYEEAFEAYNQALTIDPNYQDSYNKKGNDINSGFKEIDGILKKSNQFIDKRKITQQYTEKQELEYCPQYKKIKIEDTQIKDLENQHLQDLIDTQNPRNETKIEECVGGIEEVNISGNNISYDSSE